MVVKPVVQGSADVWGTILNTALDELQAGVDASLRTDATTAAGDLYAGTAAATMARLPVGADGSVLTADATAGTGLAWKPPRVPAYTPANRPDPAALGDGAIWIDSSTGQLWTVYAGRHCPWPGSSVFTAHRMAGQTLPTAAYIPIAWDTVTGDRLAGWAAATPSRYTIKIPGVYALAGTAAFASSSGGTYRGASWYRNGSIIPGGTEQAAYTSPAGADCTVPARTLHLNLTTGDWIELRQVHNIGATITTGGLAASIAISYLGPA